MIFKVQILNRIYTDYYYITDDQIQETLFIHCESLQRPVFYRHCEITTEDKLRENLYKFGNIINNDAAILLYQSHLRILNPSNN